MRISALLCGLLCVTIATVWESGFAADAGKGLYADDTKDKTSGDLKDQDYWWAKWDIKNLEDAIKTRQPEGNIGLNCVGAIKRLEALIEKYPKHEELKKWKARFEEVQKKIDPNAPRGGSWKPGFPWDMANYAQAWVNWHYAQMLAADNDVQQAVSMLQNVTYNFRLINEHKDTFKDMPEECHKFVEETTPKAEKLMADLKKKH
jgi:hypothetical protein